MQYSSALVAAMALAMVNAVSFTNPAFNGITAGQPITLTWTDANGPVSIDLKNGASTDLKTVSNVASGQTSGSYTWNVPSTLTQDTYALEITDSSGKPNYSPQFQLIGGAAASSVSSVVSSAVSSVSSVLSSQSAAASSSVSSVAASVSSLVSSIVSNATSSAAPSSTAASNATTSTGGSSTSKPTSTGAKTTSAPAGTGSPTTVPNSNSAVQIASPLALVFLTFAAIFSLN